MTELKTQRNHGDVMEYLDSVENQRRREDALVKDRAPVALM